MTTGRDQAATLRLWTQSHRAPVVQASLINQGTLVDQLGSVVAIGGGKGGIGKTVLTANLACALGKSGRRTLAVDADLGLSNLDLALGVAPRHTLLDVACDGMSLTDAICEVAPNVSLLAGALGRMELAGLPPHARLSLTDAIGRIKNSYDVVLLDMSSGVSEHVMHFAQAAARVVVVATPEPTALADAYAFVKVLRARCGIKEASFIANMVRSVSEGEALYGRLAQLVERFLGVDLGFLGALCVDHQVSESIRRGRPFVLHNNAQNLSCHIDAMASRLMRLVSQHDPHPNWASVAVCAPKTHGSSQWGEGA